jgi:hypothetical protein
MTFRSILDPSFKYRNAASTDVRETFKRIRREARQGSTATRNADVPNSKVIAIAGSARRNRAAM